MSNDTGGNLNPLHFQPGINIFVVWAPQTMDGRDISEGSGLAKKIYAHFCYDTKNPLFGGLAIPVYFRSAPYGVEDNSSPRPIDFESAERTIVIILVDAEMALGATWESYISDIVTKVEQSNRQHLVLPVALSHGALNFEPLRSKNSIRYYKFSELSSWLQLRLWLTNEIARHFRTNLNKNEEHEQPLSPPPVRIFLSHAKIDGRDEALLMRQCLDKIPSVPFFDEVDIGPGYDIASEIIERIKDATVIVFLTDMYSDRPWCQKEILAAKKFQRPIVIVDDLQGKVFRSFPYLGNVPTIRKSKGDEAEILSLALDEALRHMVLNHNMAQTIQNNPQLKHSNFLMRAPEASDGGAFAKMAPALEETTSADPVTIFYPGPPLGPDEMNLLQYVFQGRYHFATPIYRDGIERLSKWTVGISISESEELVNLGFSEMQLAEAMSRIAVYLLAGGAVLAYGGDLRAGGFTEVLTDIVATYNSYGNEDFKPIENYQAWPFYLAVTRNREAELSRIAHLHRIPTRSDVKAKFEIEPDQENSVANSEKLLIITQCLTQMRQAINEKANVRILMGGRLTEFSGVLPGVLEEAYLALDSNKPLFLIGAFGGCSQAVIDLICGQDSPALFTALNSRDSNIIDKYQKILEEPERLNYDYIKRFFADCGVRSLNNGLTDELNRKLFTEQDTHRIISLILHGLDNLSLQ
ncbi:hypothetical protein CCAX7_11370 [Capsulimonas corticalis]|uniref:Uncharacterized protein n=1 Tax=Capsulimonas corticalis TaxID=2219043 RepID=A0A402CUT1_9BACT|nr:TIR domain-containing protein [Capsulimonas corticalis]BDI29086.1 hypothetical protein CCAX7_11370 [Capsulimonas corticalis]